MDQLAAELGIDRLELRRRNFIPKEDFPATVAVGLTYDSGDYHGALARLLEMVDLEQFEREQEELRARGVYRGIGFSTYMEICGLAPSRVVGPSGVGLQGGLLGVRGRARPSVGQRDRVQRRVPPRPGPRHELRPDRRRPPRRHAAAGRRDPRRHRARPVRDGHVRLALARGRRRVGRSRGRQGRDEGREDRRAPARGLTRRHGAARRPLLGARLARGRDGARRDRARRLRAREPARGDGARARGDDLLRPRQLRLPVRRARLRRRGRRRHRQGQRPALVLRRRLRPGDQPDADRRPDPRRHRARRSARRCSSRSPTTRRASS